jgi:hypothetical protein
MKQFPVGHSHKQGLELITPGMDLQWMGGKKTGEQALPLHQLLYRDGKVADTLSGGMEHSVGDGSGSFDNADFANRLAFEGAGVKVRLADRMPGYIHRHDVLARLLLVIRA